MVEKKNANKSAKSPPPETFEPIHNTLLTIIELIESLHSTPELEDVKNDAKEGRAGIDGRARKEIYKVVHFLLEEGGFNKAFVDLEETVRSTNDRVGQLLTEISNRDLEKFLVPGILKRRYEENHPEPKERAANYVANKFFTTNERENNRASCFIQASTTAIHLARDLSSIKIPSGSLFYTNSIAFPLILLQSHNEISVYTHCGRGYDDLCGGWFPHHGDDEARDHLEKLFTREEHPLRDSVLTPIAISIDNAELFFTKSEIASMVNTLVENSSGLIMMSFRSRIFDSKDDAEAYFSDTALYSIEKNNWTENGAAPQLVIAYDKGNSRTEEQWKDSVKRLCKKGFKVHWQDPELKWHRATLNNNIKTS